ncbi:MAG: DUF424 family protein [Candidatus Bathyarchaeota archaeon]|nr:MAG: DUF424 family protein [Candidatus Bathyarchaeota archaeon]
MDIYINLRRTGKFVLLAMCDAEILGKTLKQGNIVFCVREKFYKGSLVSLEEAIDLIHQSTVVNMVGQKIVNKAIEEGLVHPEAVLKIEGIPHAQIIRL